MNIEELSKEHEQLFPNASPESQFWKLEEEINEFEQAKTFEQKIKELADIRIVCAGLYRFFPKTAKAVMISYYDVIDEDDVQSEVNRKWSINKSRKWEWNGKTYKHVGKDGNE